MDHVRSNQSSYVKNLWLRLVHIIELVLKQWCGIWVGDCKGHEIHCTAQCSAKCSSLVAIITTLSGLSIGYSPVYTGDPDPDPDWLHVFTLDSNPDLDHLSHVYNVIQIRIQIQDLVLV